MMRRRQFFQNSIAPVVGTGLIGCANKNIKYEETHDDTLKIKEYRTLGRTGFKVSDIGFGGGFLNNAEVLDVALNVGVNYIDTAEHYMNGQSERTIGEVISKRKRESIFLTTKLNINNFGEGTKIESTKEEIKQRFHKCLQRLRTDYVDCLMNHMVSNAELVRHDGFHRAVQELKSEGKVRFVGLSNHGLEHRIGGNVEESMEKILMAGVEDGRYDMVLMVYNFLQKKQGEAIIKACKEKNMGITLMKTDPVNEYIFVKNYYDEQAEKGEPSSEETMKRMDEFKLWLNQAETFKKKYGLQSNEEVRKAAITFCLNNQDIHSVCATMNSFDDLEKFIGLSGGRLEVSDSSMLEDYKTAFGQLYCRHACGICEKACPYNIPINTIMRYNHYFQAQKREKYAVEKYAKLSQRTAERCHNCSGHCESECPYNVPIQGLLIEAHKNLSLA